jgi:hypothetical protein
MSLRLLKGDIFTTNGNCFISSKTALSARYRRVEAVVNAKTFADFIPVEIRPKQFVLRHKMSVNFADASVTPNLGGEPLTFNVLGHLPVWPHIIPLANNLDHEQACSIAIEFSGSQYVEEQQKAESERLNIAETQDAQRRERMAREVTALGCSIEDAIAVALLKAKTKVLSLRRSEDKELILCAEKNLRNMRRASFDVDDYLVAIIHSNVSSEWPCGDLFTDIKEKIAMQEVAND